MLDIPSLITICQTALQGGSSVFEAIRRRHLSHEEQDLLIQSARDGEFLILSVEQISGSWVRASGRNYQSGDPAYAAKYLEAFGHLCERGYVRHDGGQLFVLTAAGFERARALALKTSE